MQATLKKHAKKLRFALVGGANTALDFGTLFLLVALGIDRYIGNFVSTGIAFVFSFFANKSFTFKAKDGNTKREFILFVVITLFGLWVIQPIVIAIFTNLSTPLGLTAGWSLFIGKIIATMFSLTWNYVLYSRFVFKSQA